MKRLFDILASFTALVLLSPLLVGIGLAVIASSGRPALFRHRRVGLNGVPFDVYKFRTMSPSGGAGAAVTASTDQRITRIGGVLRRFKLDELPQLWNVLRGDMSVVGPRPEVDRYVDEYPVEFALLHQVRPGITDPASLEFRNEEELLGEVDEPEEFYIAEILPKKIALSLAYVENQSLLGDLGLIAATARALIGRRS